MSFRDDKIIRPVWPYALNHASPQAQGLVAWYPMAAPGGNTIFDMSRGGRHLVSNSPANTIWGALPEGGGASVSNTTNGWCSVTSTPVTTAPVSMGFWVNPGTTLNGVAFMVGNTTPWNAWYIEISGNAWAASTAENTTFASATGPAVVANRLVHIFAVFESATSRKIYVNGKLIATDTTSRAPVGVNAIRLFADMSAGNQTFNSTGDTRIYNRALSEAEVYALYDAQTRFDLYWELGRRLTIIPAQVIQPNPVTQSVSVPQPTVIGGAATVVPNVINQAITIPQPSLRNAIAGATLTATDAVVTTLTASDQLVEAP